MASTCHNAMVVGRKSVSNCCREERRSRVSVICILVIRGYQKDQCVFKSTASKTINRGSHVFTKKDKNADICAKYNRLHVKG